MVKITKAKVQKYEDVRQSGVTNMFDLKKVTQLSGLTKEECLDIMGNYNTYIKKFKIERD
jgi:hypothetical protein